MKKALNIIKNIFVGIVVAFAVLVMVLTILSKTSIGDGKDGLFGYNAYIVLSDSMSPDFSAGSLVFTEPVAPGKLKVGDIITYKSESKNEDEYGQLVTHKIREITRDANGDLAFTTYGTKTNTNDEAAVREYNVRGRYSFSIPFLGHFFAFLKTPTGYFVCIFIPFMLLIVYQGINSIRLFKRYKAEQKAEIEEERAKIEAERAEAARMVAELKALKEELQMNTSSPAAEKEKTPEPDGKDSDASEKDNTETADE